MAHKRSSLFRKSYPAAVLIGALAMWSTANSMDRSGESTAPNRSPPPSPKRETKYKAQLQPRPCNICSHAFMPTTQFDRFCKACKEESDLFRFGEWLPELDTDVIEKISA